MVGRPARDWVEAGVAGFRVLRLGHLPSAALRRTLEGLRRHASESLLLGWTPGLPLDHLPELEGIGLDFVFSSLPWWDFRADWFWTEADALSRIAPVIAAPEAPFGRAPPRFLARPGGTACGVSARALVCGRHRDRLAHADGLRIRRRPVPRPSPRRGRGLGADPRECAVRSVPARERGQRGPPGRARCRLPQRAAPAFRPRRGRDRRAAYRCGGPALRPPGNDDSRQHRSGAPQHGVGFAAADRGGRPLPALHPASSGRGGGARAWRYSELWKRPKSSCCMARPRTPRLRHVRRCATAPESRARCRGWRSRTSHRASTTGRSR